MREPFGDVLVGALANMTGRLLDVVPRLSVLGLFVALGAAGAWAVAGLAQAALRAADFDRAAIRWGLWRILQAGGIRRSPTDVLAGALGACTFAFAALVALDAVEVPGAGSAAGMILGVLPRAIGGALVMILGVLAGRLGAFGTRLAWTRCGWGRADLAGAAAAWTVRTVAAGFALVVLGVPPVAILIAPIVPLGVIGLAAALGIAQVARARARRAAARWARSLFPSREAVQPCPPAPSGEPAGAAATVRGPAVGAGVKVIARLRPFEE